uniref:Uncharacterized protein n=1 Tax=Prevotella sp. GTC17254 TaxID=3236794 RepID=A0AB33J3V1_9BACT
MTREELFEKLREAEIPFSEDMLSEVFDYMKDNLDGGDTIDVISD